MLKIKVGKISVNGNPLKFSKKQQTIHFPLAKKAGETTVVLSVKKSNAPISFTIKTDSLGIISDNPKWTVPDEMVQKVVPKTHEYALVYTTSSNKSMIFQKATTVASADLVAKLKPESVSTSTDGKGSSSKSVEGKLRGIDDLNYVYNFIKPLNVYEFLGIKIAPKDQ